MMKPILSALFAAVLISGCAATVQPAPPAAESHCTRNVIVYHDPDSRAAVLAAAKQYGATVLYAYDNFNAVALTPPAGRSVVQAQAYFDKVQGVQSTVCDQIVSLH